jgi:hypothetical protein
MAETTIFYVLRDKGTIYFKTSDFVQAEKMFKEYKASGRSVWVDLETEDGQPHPCLTQ